MKDFHDTHDNLSSWLSAKDRMMTVLGPICSDSRMVQSQVQQVQVLREEFRTQQPQLNHLSEVGEAVLSHLDPDTADSQRVSSSLNSVLQRWADLLGRLEERANSLGAAVDTSREFDAGLNRLKDALQGISDQLDDLPLDKDPEDQLRKIEVSDFFFVNIVNFIDTFNKSCGNETIWKREVPKIGIKELMYANTQ